MDPLERLDDLLDRSSPAVAGRSDGLTSELNSLASSTRPARRRRLVPRVALGLGIASVLVGGAAAAAASTTGPSRAVEGPCTITVAAVADDSASVDAAAAGDDVVVLQVTGDESGTATCGSGD
ncbi:hypothetical protein [Microbacterium gorillae]|uniref:hypothetical protein n=1 Tax=Microbacterium gorillae TaxID=1231063 RepID=UPI000B261E8D|nr:hypothetical protein [Microbacterium gorillae]